MLTIKDLAHSLILCGSLVLNLGLVLAVCLSVSA